MSADKTNRLLAKFVDFLVAGALWKIFPSPIGLLGACTYLLIADGMPPNGQSLGKRLIGLRVAYDPNSPSPKPCPWKNSMIRNIPFALLPVAQSMGFLGVLVFVVAVVLIAFEVYFVFTDAQRIRLGDIFANTKVLNR